MDHAVVIIGGAPPDPRAVALVGSMSRLPSASLSARDSMSGSLSASLSARGSAFVVAADSGLDHARALGLDVDLVVGDRDSVSPDALAWAEDRAIPVERFPVDKDATDTELAVVAAIEHGARHVVLLTGAGDRLDHVLSVVLLLGHPAFASVVLEAWVGRAHLLRVLGPGTLVVPAAPGETVSLLPIGGPVHGITTTGLQYPLADETLAPATSRGVSNVVASTVTPTVTPSVTVTQGTLLVIRPEALP